MWLVEAVPLMRQVCREVVAANAGLVAEQRGLAPRRSWNGSRKMLGTNMEGLNRNGKRSWKRSWKRMERNERDGSRMEKSGKE